MCNGMRVTKKCMMACNVEMRTVQQDSWYWNSEMHGHVTRYCFHLTGFCCFIFLNKLATIENTTAIYLQKTRFSGLFQQLATCSTTWFRWYNAMITSRAEPANVQETTLCVFFFVTQWYHATNASHGAVCQFSKYSDGLKLRMLGPSSSRTPKECRRENK
jgi:hypothetical protein